MAFPLPGHLHAFSKRPSKGQAILQEAHSETKLCTYYAGAAIEINFRFRVSILFAILTHKIAGRVEGCGMRLLHVVGLGA